MRSNTILIFLLMIVLSSCLNAILPANITEDQLSKAILINPNNASSNTSYRLLELDDASYYEYPVNSGNWHIMRSNSASSTQKLDAPPATQTAIRSKRTRDPEPLSAALNSLNSQNFPFIYANVAVSSNGEGIATLDATNFNIYENGVLQSNFIEVTPPESGAGQRLADIVFCLDVSGSMGGTITSVKNNMISFIQGLETSGIDYRIGFITYGDIYYVYNNHNLYSEYSQILSIVNGISLGEYGIGSGGDGPENQIGSMAESATFNYRPGAQKVVIMLTDAPSHEADWATPWTVQSLINERLLPNSITVFPVFYTSDYLQQQQYIPIAEATNPNATYFNIYSNFNAIITEIGNLVANSYVVRYRTNNPEYDGVLRNVEYQVNYMGNSAVASGTYQPGAAPQISRTPQTLAWHNQSWPENTNITLSVMVTDLFEPFTTAVRLLYRTTGTGTYTNVAMSRIPDTDLWQANINPAQVLAPGLDYYFTATDGQTTSTSPTVDPSTNPYQITILPNEAPVLRHTPITQVLQYSSVFISAFASDDTNELEEVKLFYRSFGQLSYNPVAMILARNGIYEASIPAAVIGTNGADYFIRATDDFGVSSYSGNADNPHHISTMLDGTMVPGGEITQSHWSSANSPYYVDADIFLSEGQNLLIDPEVEIRFSPNTSFTIYGSLNANAVVFTARYPEQAWEGIIFDVLSTNNTFNNCSILYAKRALVLNSSQLAFSYTRIRKSATVTYVDESALVLNGESNPQIDNLDIENYNMGIQINNEQRTVSTPTLTNIRIRNSSSSSRTEATAMSISGAVALSLTDALIEDYDTGVHYDGSAVVYDRTTPTLTNIRIRNSSSSSRNDVYGIVLSDMTLAELEDIEIESDSSSFNAGIKIMATNDTLRVSSTPTLTNIRIRNSSSSSRNLSTGIDIQGAVSPTLSDVEISDHSTGISYAANVSEARITPTLTNIRIRNSSSSSRNDNFGISITGNVAVEMDDVEIENVSTGISYIADSGANLRSTPTLTNIRIRNSSSSSRIPPVGMHLENMNGLILNQNLIYSSTTGVVDGEGIVLNNVNDAVINHSTVFGFDTGIHLANSTSTEFYRNIVWAEAANGLADAIISDVPLPADGCYVYLPNGEIYNNNPTNHNQDPKFVDPITGNFYLKLRSPLRAWNDDENLIHKFVFEEIALNRERTMYPGWNLMGVPYTADVNMNNPVAIFADDIDPFYVHPSYTSIVKMNNYNTDANINPWDPNFGKYHFTHTGTYNVPSLVNPPIGYWVNNLNTPTTIDIMGLMDDGVYEMNLPNVGWYLLANPYAAFHQRDEAIPDFAAISFSDGITLDLPGVPAGSYEPYGFVYRYNQLTNQTSYSVISPDEQDPQNTIFKPWEAFFFRAPVPNTKLTFSWPQLGRSNFSAPQQLPVISRSNDLSSENANDHSEPVEWNLVLSAKYADFREDIAVGARSNALDTYDPYDLQKLPSAPFVMNRPIVLGIDNSSWENEAGLYARDTKALAGDSWQWNILLDASQLLNDQVYDGVITVSLSEKSNIPSGYQFALINTLDGISIDPSGSELQIDLRTLYNNGNIPLPDAAQRSRSALGSRSSATDHNINPELFMIPLLLVVQAPTPSEPALISQSPIIHSGNYPNPFNPETRISYSTGKDAKVSLEIYNIKGQKVKTLVNAWQSSGSHNVVWNGTDESGAKVSSGIYLYRLSVDKASFTKKILMTK